MIKSKVGFIVFGVHKDGLLDPLGTPFVDEKLVAKAKESLRNAGLELVENDIVVASKAEAKECFSRFKKMDDLAAVVLFSGTWVWSSNLIGAIRDFSGTGKGIVIWTHSGSQGWRPVGGLVMHGALKEIGLQYRYVYGSHDNPKDIERVVSYCRASALKCSLNMSTIGVFGGRGMGQTCGVADPSQWMKVFGIDIDSRDTTELINTAKGITEQEIQDARNRIQPLFAKPIPEDYSSERSLRLYLALKKIVEREHFDFYTIQSFPGLGDDYSTTCFAQSMMLEDGYGNSTVSDFNTALTSKCLVDLSLEKVYYGDLQHVDKSNNEIKIISDGACPPSLAGKLGPAGFSEHGIPTEGAAGGMSIDLVCKVGEGVVAHLGRSNGNFEMVISRCAIFEPPAHLLEKRRNECGIPFWPHGFVTVHCDIEDLLQAWNSEMACLGYGKHLYEELKAFCELTGIKAIAI
jgi:L-fucose isomerase-like protein